MMKTRVITAVVAIALFIPILFVFPPIVAEIVFSAFCAVGAYELLVETKTVEKTSPFWWISAGFAIIISLGSVYYPGKLYAIAYVYIFTAFCFSIKNREKYPFSTVLKGIFASLIAPFLLSSVARILENPQGRYIILLPWVCVWICDSTALFCGKAFGKHKLAPTVSPKKTVEGSLGGLVGAVIAAFLYVIIVNSVFATELKLVPALIFGAVGSTAGQIGDLVFSIFKREAGIKDYGKIFPGHGGVYDRFDSITFAAAFFEIFCIGLYPVI